MFKIELSNTQESSPQYQSCTSYKTLLDGHPSENYEYSLLFVKSLDSVPIPQKLSKFFDFIKLNNLQKNLEKNCLGKPFSIF